MKATEFGVATSPSSCQGSIVPSHLMSGGPGLVNFGDLRQVSRATLSSAHCFHAFDDSYLSGLPEDRSS
jgi:hypothetical protein